MRKTDGVVSATYRRIAIDIAKNIAEGKYSEGQKLFGRSVLSSYYNVSPETIRKAVYILKDVGIVDTEKGSGVEIISSEKAVEFVARNEEVRCIATIKQEIVTWAKRQEKETVEIVEKIKYIAAAAEKIKIFNPFTPFEITVSENSAVLNKTISEMQVWQKTGVTIIAIKCGDDILLSPGPYASFRLGDIVYVIGSEQACAVAKNYIE